MFFFQVISRFLQEISEDFFVHVPGVVCVGFHGEHIEPELFLTFALCFAFFGLSIGLSYDLMFREFCVMSAYTIFWQVFACLSSSCC